MNDVNNDLTPASRAYLARNPTSVRKGLGQYLTPRHLRERLLDHIELREGIRVLDPGVGTGEFLLSVHEREPTARLVGWDIDPEMLDVAKTLVPDATLEERNALDGTDERFDVIVGNPPYFQMYLTDKERRHFADVISGRVNIFALFFHVALKALKDGGQLGFVVPPSMNNGAYFAALRRFILREAAIEHLEITGPFVGASTAIQILVLRKGASGRRHVFEAGNRLIFCQDPSRMRQRFDQGRTLHELGYKAVTGKTVWNNHRRELRWEPSPNSVRLIRSANIVDGEIVERDDFPQWISTSKVFYAPAIVVNRVVGSVGGARLRWALVTEPPTFAAENHVNVVLARSPKVSWKRLAAGLDGLDGYVRELTGNTQLSATELTHLVPLNV